MNVLPVAGPFSPVRPRVPLDLTRIASVTALEGVGLSNPQLSTSTGRQAAADLHLSETLKSLGNTAAANFFSGRAAQTNPDAVKALTPSVAPAIASRTVSPNLVVNTPVNLRIGNVPTLSAFPIAFTPIVTLPPAVTVTRTLGIFAGGKVSTISWADGQSPALQDVKTAAYIGRVASAFLTDSISVPAIASDFVLAIPHTYFYVIPLGLAQCYQALGDWSQSEHFYLLAAGYTFLNAAVEAPYVWIGLATLYLDWGDQLYRSGDFANALKEYTNVLNADSSVPANSPLYSLASLASATASARSVVTNLAGLVANPDSAGTLNLNPQMCSVILQVHQRVVQLNAGLDFWGHWAPRVPIWTFAYLQQVAVNFAQLAISAEQQVISFWDHADQGQLSKLELQQQVASALAEVMAAQTQTQSAQAEQAVYQVGVALAQQRAGDAQANAIEYQKTSSSAIVHQALQAQLGGGDSGNAAQLNAYADTMMSGNYNLSDSGATLAAAEQLTASRLSQQYQVDSLQRTANELVTAQAQAQAELNASNAQVAAAQAAQAVASLKAKQALSTLNAFNNQTFTPDVWQAMGNEMMRLYRRYFGMALKVAELMQQAYNFETDQQLSVIKTSYATNEIKGLLGADSLMADIQGFTYNLITTTKSKTQPIKQTISLSQQYGWQFETQLRKTGSMSFETRIEDFDNKFPGTYAGRIKSVEVNVIGLVPVTGLSAMLTNAGISWYRLPGALWATNNASGLKARIQTAETLVLSDYSAQTDSLLINADERISGIFDGAGVASSWQLDIPKEVNDIDFGALLDVTITFLYSARYDPSLAAKVKAQLDSRPGNTARQRGIPLRWIYPDLFFNFAQTGQLALTLGMGDFPLSESQPQVVSVGLQVSTASPLLPSGITFSLATSGNGAAVKATTDVSGTISSLSAGSSWSVLATGAALGQYQLSAAAADNPGLVKNGTLDLSNIQNIALVLGYTFTPRS
jgi:hypothetical protein